MINQISFKNYKAFKEGEINIRPLTIFLGANSVGKSSIIQLLLMLQQTSMLNKHKSVLRLHGEFVSLGENENIFNQKNIDKKIELAFDFSDTQLFYFIKDEIGTFLFSSLQNRIALSKSFIIHFINDNNLNVPKDIFDSLQFKKINKNEKLISEEAFISIWEELLKIGNFLKNNEMRVSPEDGEDGEAFSLNEQILGVLLPEERNDKKINIPDLVDLFSLTKELSKIESREFRLSFEIVNLKTANKDVLKISSIRLSHDGKCILEFDFEIDKTKEKYANVKIKSELVDDKKFLFENETNSLLKSIQYDSTMFYLFQTSDYYNPTTDYNLNKSSISSISIPFILNSIFSSTLEALKKNFTNGMVNYVSPLRAHPKRYYFLDKANINISLDTLDGNSLTEILKENTPLKHRVNEWLNKFDIAVNVSTLEDVIHKLKIKQNGLSLDITDVGFGISQVLPVIVQGFLSSINSLTMIEQPEIHLHPKMQADLADLFIDIINTAGKDESTKFLIVETHSEYLLKRLRRRLSEKRTIRNSDVGIYFFEPQGDNQYCSIRNKKIDYDGAFEWPKNFYSGELLKDTVEFIKNQRY